jgi:hypothetical protein
MDISSGGIPSTDEFVRLLVHTLTTGPGLLALIGLLALAVAAAVSKKARWVALAGVVYMGTFGFSWMPWFHHVLIGPLEILRSQSRDLCIALMLVVCLGACFSARGTRGTLMIGATVAVFMFELLYSGRLMLGGWFTKGALGAVLFTLTFGTFAIALPLLLQDLKDVHSAIRCLAVAGTLLCLGTAVQLAIDRHGVIDNGRLASTPGTATHTAEAIAVTLPALLYLLLSRSEPKVLRALWLVAAGGLVIFLANTGTRNGLLMVFLSLVFLFRRRMGKMVIVAALVGIAAAIVWQFFGTERAAETARRLVDTTDTRTMVWAVTWRDFVAHPVFGLSTADTFTTENSYISVAARMGLFGLIPMALALGAVGWALWRLNGLRRFLGEDTLLADYLIGGFIALAAGAFFDAFLLGMLKLEVYTLYIYLAIVTFIFDKMRQVMSADPPPEAIEPWQPEYEPELVAHEMAGHYS